MKSRFEEFENRGFELTTWINPTPATVTVKVWRGPESSRDPWQFMTIPPGEERQFPTEYDNAIHVLDKNGVIVGGKAPQLRKKGASYHLDPVLDTNLQERQRAVQAAAANLAEKQVYEQAAMLAAAQIKASEEAIIQEQKVREALAVEKEAHRIVAKERAEADKKAVKELQDKMIEEKLASKNKENKESK